MRIASDQSCRENQNTIFSQDFFFENGVLLLDNVGKYCTAGQATDNNMAHAHCMVDN